MASIDRARLLELTDDGVQVADVLSDAEYTAQHIPGAISIPLRRLDELAACSEATTDGNR